MLVSCRPVSQETGALLALAMWPDPARIQAALERYDTDPGLQVWGWQVEGRPVCAAGLRVLGRSAETLHIGTRADSRRRGHAQRLVRAVATHLNLTLLEAETDDDSVEFYRRAGFGVRETAGRGGHVRYHCTLTLPA